jgi:hypothetical protein
MCAADTARFERVDNDAAYGFVLGQFPTIARDTQVMDGSTRARSRKGIQE